MMLRNIILLMLAFVSQALMAQRQKIDTLIITPNAAVGKVLVSDADGKATWTAAADLTTVDIEGKSNGFIITVNGKKDTFIPPIGTIGDKILGFDAAGNIVKGVLKKEKIVCAGTRTQVINNSNVSSNSTILLSYQDPSRIIYPAILSINPGVSFTVQFSSIPPTSAILHYTIID